MASAPREFALDFNRGIISASTAFELTYAFKKFKSGDGEWFAITLVQANTGAGAGKLSVVSPTGLTLKIAIGQLAAGSAGTVYTSVTCSIVGNQFVGKLPMNVAAIAALFASQSADVEAIIEFELTDGGEPKSMDFPVTIRQHIISNTLVDTTAPDTALGRQEASGLYVPIIAIQGFRRIVTDEDTGEQFLEYFAGGAMRYDPIT